MITVSPCNYKIVVKSSSTGQLFMLKRNGKYLGSILPKYMRAESMVFNSGGDRLLIFIEDGNIVSYDMTRLKLGKVRG